MIKHKAACGSLPKIQFTKSETRGTCVSCPECGGIGPKERKNAVLRTMLHVHGRDVNACINQAKMGRMRLLRSFREEKGPPAEAVERMAGSQVI